MSKNAATQTQNTAPAQPESKPADKAKVDEKRITLADLSDEDKKGFRKQLAACELAITKAAKTYAQAAWHIGQNLKTIRDNHLYLVAPKALDSDGKVTKHCETFEEYLAQKAEWQLSKMSAYNFINLTNLDVEVVTELGLTASYKVATMKTPIVAIEAFRKAKEEGANFKKAIAVVQELAKEERDDNGEKRSTGRSARVPAGPEGENKTASDVKPDVKTITTPTGRVGEVPVTKVMDQTIVLEPVTDPDLVAQGFTHQGKFAVGSSRAEVIINLAKNVVRIKPV